MARGLTPSQTVGPFFSFGLVEESSSNVVPAGTEGVIQISGTVFDGAGAPIPDAMVEIWQADADGVYRSDFGWGRSGTEDGGRYTFTTMKPGAVQGDNGTLQAPHVIVMVFARGLLKQAVTRMYFPDEESANAADPFLTAIGNPEAVARLVALPAGAGYRFDIRMQGDGETPFFAW